MPIIESHSGIPAFPFTISEWARPTGSYLPFTGTYPAGAYEGGQPTSAPSLGHSISDQGNTRGANYFFGFLITFISLLLIFVACGMGSRRRMATRRREMELTEAGPGMGRFGALGNRRLTNEEMLKKKPTYHEVWLSLDSDKEPVDVKPDPKNAVDSQKGGVPTWSNMEPLSATFLRMPRDLQPYQHFQDVLASSSTHQPAGSDGLRSPQEILPTYESSERDLGTWYTRVLAAWSPRPGYPTPAIRDVGTPPPLSPIPGTSNQTGNANSLGEKEAGSGTASLGASEDIQVAVVVMMPNEGGHTDGREDSEESLGKNLSQRSIPECQIGTTTGRVVAQRA